MRSKELLKIREVLLEFITPLSQRVERLENYVKLHCDHRGTLEYQWSSFYEEYQERCTVCGKVTRIFSGSNEFEIAKLENKRAVIERRLATLKEAGDDG